MLASLPITAFLGIFLVLLNARPVSDWRRIFLRAAVIWGAYLVLGTELISLIHAVTQIGLVIFWLVVNIASIVWFVHRARKGKRLILPQWRIPAAWSERVLLLVVVIVCAITALIAWVAPPNTVDSLQYHMPKVAHWAQDKSVHFYTTGMFAQNNMPPGAEMIILQFYVLAQSDRLATFAEWLAMLGSLIGIGLIAAQLGARPIGQWFAAIFAVTLPMSIAQSSSTMTDYVVGFWVICAASEVFAAFTEALDWQIPVIAGLAAGLGVQTKPTAVAYLLPFGALLGIKIIQRFGIKRALIWGLTAFILAVSIDSGHITRTYITYGNLLSDPEHIAEQANALVTPQGILSNIVRNAALHTGTRWNQVTENVWLLVLKIHIKLGVDMDDPRTTSVGPFRKIRYDLGENTTGNPAHAALILFSVPLFFIFFRRLGNYSVIYVLAVSSTFIIFSTLFKWQIFASRYHLPFFLLYAPLIGVLLARFLPAWGVDLPGVALLVLAWPWLVTLPERPLIVDSANTSYPSIFRQSRAELYYSPSVRGAIPLYFNVLGQIAQANCSSIGLMISGSDGLEYPIWVYLHAPRDDLQIEWIVTGPTRRYAKPGFQPCAVICQFCPSEWQTVRNLPLVFDNGMGFKLFLAPPPPSQ